jgi:2-dehydropantoate 2-reductase
VRILVVGAGAIGGYFGARLAAAGRNVTFLVRKKRLEQLQRDGIRITSPHGDLALMPQVMTAAELSDAYDLILLGVKAFALDAALVDIARAVGPKTTILPMLNGMHHMDVLVSRFGENVVIGGLAYIATELEAEGRIVQLTGQQEVAYGERSGAITRRITEVDGQLRGAGFDTRLSDRIVAEMWEKWEMLSALGGITCTMRGTIGDIVAAPGGVAFIEAFLAECIAVAAAAGFSPPETFVARTRTVLTQRGSPLTSSMYRDLVAKNDVEADQILGDLVERGRSAGLETPLLATAYTNLKVYQGRL